MTLRVNRVEFIKGFLLPLMGEPVLFVGDPKNAVVRRWDFSQKRIVIHFQKRSLEIEWDDYREKPELVRGVLRMPGRGVRQRLLLNKELAELVAQWARGIGELTEVQQNVKNQALVDKLPTVISTLRGVLSKQDRAARVPALRAGTKGAVKLGQLKMGKWYLHPEKGWLTPKKITMENGGTLLFLNYSPWPGDVEQRTRLSGQQNVLFARGNSPAEKNLLFLRAKQHFPLQNYALFLAFSALYERTKSDEQRYSQLYQTLEVTDTQLNTLGKLLTWLRFKLFNRGIGYDVDYSAEIAIVRRFVKLVYEKFGEDLIRSGNLQTIPKDSSDVVSVNLSKEHLGQVFDIEYRFGESGYRTCLAAQLRAIPWDVHVTVRKRFWQLGRNSFDQKPSRASFLGTWMFDLLPIRTRKSEDPLADRDTRDVRFVADFRSLERAIEIVRRNEDKIKGWLDVSSFDVVTMMPGTAGKQAASYLFAQAIAQVFEVASHKFRALLTRKPGRTKTRRRKQKGLRTLIERLSHLRGRFYPFDTKSIAGQRILLVDDVSASYSTVEEGRRKLMEYGAKEVVVLNIAHCSRTENDTKEPHDPRAQWLQYFQANPPEPDEASVESEVAGLLLKGRSFEEIQKSFAPRNRSLVAESAKQEWASRIRSYFSGSLSREEFVRFYLGLGTLLDRKAFLRVMFHQDFEDRTLERVQAFLDSDKVMENSSETPLWIANRLDELKPKTPAPNSAGVGTGENGSREAHVSELVKELIQLSEGEEDLTWQGLEKRISLPGGPGRAPEMRLALLGRLVEVVNSGEYENLEQTLKAYLKLTKLSGHRQIPLANRVEALIAISNSSELPEIEKWLIRQKASPKTILETFKLFPGLGECALKYVRTQASKTASEKTRSLCEQLLGRETQTE